MTTPILQMEEGNNVQLSYCLDHMLYLFHVVFISHKLIVVISHERNNVELCLHCKWDLAMPGHGTLQSAEHKDADIKKSVTLM